MRKGLITTNEQKPTGQGEPQKLNIITSAIIPEVKPQPEPKGTDLSKMITTANMDLVNAELNEPLPQLSMIEHPVSQGPFPEGKTKTNAEGEYVPLLEIKKKAGRPKKVE